jgi:arylsulfatase A-like enzyme
MYDRAVSALDAALGRLFNVLPANTLVMLTGDHGEAFMPGPMAWLREGTFIERLAHFRKRFPEFNSVYFWFRAWRESHKQNQRRAIRVQARQVAGKNWMEAVALGPFGHGWHVYDPLVTVPLVCWWKEGIRPRQLEPAQIRQIDFMPTILEAAGVRGQGGPAIDGESFWPACLGGSISDRPAIIEACTTLRATPKSLIAALRRPPYKYACWPYAQRRNEMLFDLHADPGEERNVIDEQPAVADDLRRQFESIYHGAAGDAARPSEAQPDLTPEEQATIEATLRDLGYIK